MTGLKLLSILTRKGLDKSPSGWYNKYIKSKGADSDDDEHGDWQGDGNLDADWQMDSCPGDVRCWLPLPFHRGVAGDAPAQAGLHLRSRRTREAARRVQAGQIAQPFGRAPTLAWAHFSIIPQRQQFVKTNCVNSVLSLCA